MKLKHPNSKKTIEVTADQADLYLSQGWAEPAKKKTSTDRASGKGGTAPQTTTTEKEEA